MELNNLEKLQHFMLVNKRIKKELYEICPPVDDIFNISVIIKYLDNVYSSLKYIFLELEKVAKNYNKDFLLPKVMELKKKTMKDFLACKLNIERLRKFYKNDIADMSEELVSLVKRECIGYSGIDFPYESIKMANTINELLHVIHSYIINNEVIYKSINKVDVKKNMFNYPITLYGLSDEFALNLFKLFPFELDCAFVDIVSLGNKHVIMMIRDRGHALTIEIEKVKEGLRVNYFIPTLCNIEMINKLPGVNKVKDYNLGTTGTFVVNSEDIYINLFNFIAMVPKEDHIVYDGNSFANKSHKSL